jgi:hypothetical protein
MPNAKMNLALQHIRKLAAHSAYHHVSDRELLQRFATDHDKDAFEVLVERHGSTVLGLSRRLLRHEQDAEDVFQTTFVVLARTAWLRDLR